MDRNDDALNGPGERVVQCCDCARRYVGVEFIGKQCLGCGGDLAEVGPGAPGPCPDEPIVEVHRTPDMPEAEIIRAYLESEGILVAFRTAVPWGILTFTVDGLGEVGILALESEAERARKLIDLYLEQPEDEDDGQADTEEPS